MNPLFAFESALRQAGLEPNEIRADRHFYRCYVIGDRRGTKNGWYILNCNQVKCWGSYGTHKASEHYRWSSTVGTGFEIPMRSTREKRNCPIGIIWAKGIVPKLNHEYLLAKGISGEGLRQSGNNLLVPYRDVEGRLVALGTIKPSGDKRFISGSQPKGAFMLLGEIKQRVLICEGYATGASCYRATAIPTAIAGSAENLQSVALKIRSRYCDTEIVLMADDDRDSAINRGLVTAEKAAAMVQGIVLTPADFYLGD